MFLYFLEFLHGSENPQRISVDKCLNVDLSTIIGVPEITGLGCEFDIAGYASEAIGSHRPRIVSQNPGHQHRCSEI